MFFIDLNSSKFFSEIMANFIVLPQVKVMKIDHEPFFLYVFHHRQYYCLFVSQHSTSIQFHWIE